MFSDNFVNLLLFFWKHKIMKMNIAFQILIWVFLFKVNWAELDNCTVNIKPPNVCAMSEPSVLNATLILNDIEGIDENDNSISIQAILICKWKASQLNISTINDM